MLTSRSKLRLAYSSAALTATASPILLAWTYDFIPDGFTVHWPADRYNPLLFNFIAQMQARGYPHLQIDRFSLLSIVSLILCVPYLPVRVWLQLKSKVREVPPGGLYIMFIATAIISFMFLFGIPERQTGWRFFWEGSSIETKVFWASFEMSTFTISLAELLSLLIIAFETI